MLMLQRTLLAGQAVRLVPRVVARLAPNQAPPGGIPGKTLQAVYLTLTAY